MAKPRIEVQIAAEVGNALNGLKRATEAINQFKAAAGAAGGRITVSLGNAAKRAGTAARQIETEFSDSFAEIDAAIKASGTTAGNWSQDVTDDMRNASRAAAETGRTIGAETTQGATKAKKAVGDLSLSIDDLLRDNQELAAQMKRSYSTVEIRDYQRAIQQNNAEIQRLSNAQNALNHSAREGVAAVRGGTSAAISFGHIIQDLPYGINGVANNITQLTQNFGYMAQSAQAAGVSMKTAIIASITNPATLAVLGISALTTAIVYFTGRVGKAKEEAEELSDELNAIQEAQSSGGENAFAEVTALRTLISVAEDETRARRDRLVAVNELKKEYPEYLKQLSNEEILAGKAAETYKELEKQLRNVALARAFEQKQTEVYGELLDTALQQANQEENINNLIAKRLDLAKDLASVSLTDIMSITNDIADEQAEYNKLVEKAVKSNKDLARLEELRKSIIQQTDPRLLFGGSGGSADDFAKTASEIAENAERLFQATQDDRNRDLRNAFLYYEKLRASAKNNGQLLAEINRQAREEEAQINERYNATEIEQAEKLRKKLEESRKTLSDNIKSITEQNRLDLLSGYEKEKAEIDAEYADRAASLAEHYGRLISLAEGNFFEMVRLASELKAALIQNAAARNQAMTALEAERLEETKKAQEKAMRDMTNLQEEWTRTLSRQLEGVLFEGENIFEAIGSAFKRMISQMIADAIAADLVGALFSGKGSGLGGFLGGLLGGGLFGKGGGIGGFFKGLLNLGRKFGGFAFADGGIVSGPTLGLIGEYPGARSNPEVIAPLSDLQRYIDHSGVAGRVIVEGQIANDVIYLSNKRGAQKMQRYYGLGS